MGKDIVLVETVGSGSERLPELPGVDPLQAPGLVCEPQQEVGQHHPGVAEVDLALGAESSNARSI